jgi:hypothetical protein
MTFSIWTERATPEIIKLAAELAKKYAADPEPIFAEYTDITSRSVGIAQDAFDALEGTDSSRIEEIKTSVESVQKELVLMIIAYETWLGENQNRITCEESYGNTIALWNILDELHGHLKWRLFNMKI